MLVVSTIAHGNMHPNLEPHDPALAQANYEAFCQEQGLTDSELIGLRVDPAWEHGDTLADLVANPSLLQGITPNNVSPNLRLMADGVVLPATSGAFVLSADCFPVSLEGKEVSALCHINRKAMRDGLLQKTVRAILEYEPASNLEIHIGPGTNQSPRIATHIMGLLHEHSLLDRVVSIDPRVTCGSAELYSRQETLAGGTKPRGNHAIIMPPKSA